MSPELAHLKHRVRTSRPIKWKKKKEYNTIYDAPHTAHRRSSFLTCYASAALLNKVLHAIRGSVLPQMHLVAWQQLCNFLFFFLSEMAYFGV